MCTVEIFSNEKKGYLILEFESDGLKGGRLRQWRFHELPTRPMIQLNLHPGDMDAAKLRSYLESTIGKLPQDGIVKLKIHGRISQAAMTVLRAASLRALAPPTMNIDTSFQGYNFLWTEQNGLAEWCYNMVVWYRPVCVKQVTKVTLMRVNQLYPNLCFGSYMFFSEFPPLTYDECVGSIEFSPAR